MTTATRLRHYGILALMGAGHFLSLPATLSAQTPAPQVLSAASGAASVSPGSIVAIYGSNLAPNPAVATIPLPTILDGISVNFTVQNIIGMNLFSGSMPLFYVSPTQINALIPPGIFLPPCNGGSGSVYTAMVTINTASSSQTALVNLTQAPAPGLFSANENGTGVAAAQLVTNQANGEQTIVDVFECPGGPGTCVAVPLNVASGNSALVLWGTGISEYSTFPNGLSAMAGGQPLPVLYAGPSLLYAGLDQVNLSLPSSLAGSGTVNVSLTVSGSVQGIESVCPFAVSSNVVTIDIE
jgi:uncharacterized protein (TIGR03437 family)